MMIGEGEGTGGREEVCRIVVRWSGWAFSYLTFYRVVSFVFFSPALLLSGS